MSWGTLWLIAGPNGAGKTTLASQDEFSHWAREAIRLNADELTLQKLRAKGFATFEDAPFDVLSATFKEAADETFHDTEQLLAAGLPVLGETVLSTDKYKPLVEKVIANGGQFRLIYVALRSPQVSADRVYRRAMQGGHDVPADRLEKRWRHSLANLDWFASRAGLFWIFDNSNIDKGEPPVLVARGGEGRIFDSVAESAIFPELLEVIRTISLPKE